jgi:hypothetical protein
VIGVSAGPWAFEEQGLTLEVEGAAERRVALAGPAGAENEGAFECANVHHADRDGKLGRETVVQVDEGADLGQLFPLEEPAKKRLVGRPVPRRITSCMTKELPDRRHGRVLGKGLDPVARPGA